LKDEILSFKISNIEQFFEADAWIFFKSVYEDKVFKSECPFCNEFCLRGKGNPSIECETCSRWLHMDCLNLDPIVARQDDFHWLCPKCC